MDDELRELAAKVGCANPIAINLPKGRKPITRGPRRDPNRERAPGELSVREARERSAKLLNEKRTKLLDYYATTSLPAEKVAEHIGLYHKVQTGTDEETGKPIYTSMLDVGRVENELRWRREKAGQ